MRIGKQRSSKPTVNDKLPIPISAMLAPYSNNVNSKPWLTPLIRQCSHLTSQQFDQTVPTSSCAATRWMVDTFWDHTLAHSPYLHTRVMSPVRHVYSYLVLLTLWTTSSSVSNTVTQVTGPNISSCMHLDNTFNILGIL